jgi:phage head maturation protease
MRFYWPIAKVDAEQRMVWGYASTEALDEQGEIIKREALEAALGDYMRFANIREMHRPSAVGVAKEATIDDKGLYLAAKIVDDEAWEKVVQGVYKGFSIGGRVTARDLADRSVITGLALTEISVVD